MGERRDLNSSRGRGNFDEGYPNEYAHMTQHDAIDTRSQSSGELAYSGEFSRGRSRNRGHRGRDDRHFGADVSRSQSTGTGFGLGHQEPRSGRQHDTRGGRPRTEHRGNFYDYGTTSLQLGGETVSRPPPSQSPQRSFSGTLQPPPSQSPQRSFSQAYQPPHTRVNQQPVQRPLDQYQRPRDHYQRPRDHYQRPRGQYQQSGFNPSPVSQGGRVGSSTQPVPGPKIERRSKQQADVQMAAPIEKDWSANQT